MGNNYSSHTLGHKKFQRDGPGQYSTLSKKCKTLESSDFYWDSAPVNPTPLLDLPLHHQPPRPPTHLGKSKLPIYLKFYWKNILYVLNTLAKCRPNRTKLMERYDETENFSLCIILFDKGLIMYLLFPHRYTTCSDPHQCCTHATHTHESPTSPGHTRTNTHHPYRCSDCGHTYRS